MTMSLHPVLQADFARIASAPLPWHALDRSSVLVTGAGGLVASYVVEFLLSLREQLGVGPAVVCAVVRDLGRAQGRYAGYATRRDLLLLKQDVARPIQHDTRFDFIVHAAGRAMPSAFGGDPVGTYLPNVLGTHLLLERARRDGARGFLFVSSGAVHGVLPAHAVIAEDVYGVVDPLDLRSGYAESKRMGETMCRSWHAQYGVPTVIARLGHTYGPGVSRSDERAFAEFLYAVVDGRNIVLNSDGSAVRPYCYLADATEGMLRVLLTGSHGEAYLVQNPHATCSVRDLATIIAQLAPERRVHVQQGGEAPGVGYLPNRDPPRPVSIAKMNALGWFPTVGITDGFRRTLDTLL
ncbi:NAD-dependent epimerase/dehydratase family protein [Roseisolibacter agri]|uniref:Nucleotide sugar dehydratase n=1 Tax=Roseisolibacter agri TaxID=2014610 RepID=A0AA37QAF5_9BACT|nr:NAD-dependent epimerase/dehydratase family protein [Roseisolibacter agri]GLC26702.1 nucleotide sugar dehydratase [Roseisolibacter agri]